MTHPSINTKREDLLSTLKIVGVYCVFSFLWISFSDALLARLLDHKDAITRWQTFKGWTFILVTAVMMYALIVRSKIASTKTNLKLRQSEAKFRQVVESNMIGIIFWSAGGIIVDANDAFLKITGYTRAELLDGRVNWLAMTPPEFREADERAGEERRSVGSSFPYEKEYIRKDGSRVPVLIGIATLAEANGTHIAFVLEITERKNVEQALRKSERQLREILEKIQLVSVIFDRNGVLMFCNDFLLNLTGLRREEVIGRNWFETFVPRDQRDLIGFTFREMSKKAATPPHIEYEIETRLGQRRTISWSNTLLRDTNGTIIGITGIGEDVTERRQSERKLVNSYEQSRALSARLQLVREEERIRIAREIHDVLGQALTGLRMDVWWLAKRISESEDIERSKILRKLESMSTLINGTIPSVRKLATDLRPGVLDDLGLLAAIEWQAREFEERTGISCNCTFDVEDVEWDPDRATAVFRIFQEILTNVARHANANKVGITMKESVGSIVLEVTDDGRGIKEREVSGNQSLGLLGMRERALLFGGEVRIDRGDRKGTIVTVRIPFHLQHERQPMGEMYQTVGSA
jgi:two-component system sensor histidine kinase UhpB